LAHAAHIQRVVAAVAEGRREYEELARSLGLSTLSSAANFVAIDVGEAAQARALHRALEEHGVFVRMPSAPPLKRCIRVTVTPPAQRAAFAAILRAIWPTVRPSSGREHPRGDVVP
jgi:histidinol-phosphate aminotransferase